jgi:hypothetical protein
VDAHRPEIAEYQQTYGKQYRASDQGRAKIAAKERRYAATEEGRAANKAKMERYAKTPRGQAARTAAWLRRRARKAGATIVEAIDRQRIYELDQGMCWCGEPVDPKNFHLDHIIPLAIEPIHAEFNQRISHELCNLRRPKKKLPVPLMSPADRARWLAQRREHLRRLEEHYARVLARSPSSLAQP